MSFARLVWLPVAVLLTGCEPSCDRVCTKLLGCEAVDSPLVAEQDCIDSCETQQRLYEEWNDTQKRDAMGVYKTCITDETCSAIADGACYDEDLYSW